jgi:hypothetical protein
MPGMQLIHPAQTDGATGYTVRLTVDGYQARLGEYPDLGDPATVGCLAVLVREAWNEPELSPTYYDDGTWCVGWPDSLRHRQPSEAAALIAALEAAP